MIDQENPEITVSKRHVVYIVPVQEDVAKRYNEMFGSKLITPDKKTDRLTMKNEKVRAQEIQVVLHLLGYSWLLCIVLTTICWIWIPSHA